MSENRHGFTIVELLIVIVVIAVLATISIVAYNGMQQRADTATRQSEMMAWKKAFLAYKASSGDWPSSLNINSFYCLGTGFPIGNGGVARCRDYLSSATGYPESDSTVLMSQFQAIMSLPNMPKKPVGTTVGPYLRVLSDKTLIITQLFPLGIGVCPDGTALQYTGGSALWCEIRLEP